MTKREWFAATALQGILVNDWKAQDWNARDYTKCAVIFADALIEELNKSKQ
jgi:hypothetical protein